MIKNDLKRDVKYLLQLNGKNINTLSQELGVPSSNIHRMFTQKGIGNNLINILEHMGYDIKITYVRRNKGGSDVFSDK